MPHPTHSRKATFRHVFASLMLWTSLSEAETSIGPVLTRGYGTTLFRIKMVIPTTGSEPLPDNTDLVGQSELEYPLDVQLVGFRLRQEFQNGRGKAVGLSFSAWTNYTDPNNSMVDSDWFGSKVQSGTATSTVLFKFSRTESETKLKWHGGEAGMDLGRYTLLGNPVSYGASLRVDAFSMDMLGVRGWQRAPDQPPITLDTLSGQLVLTYALIRVIPRIYADMVLFERKWVTWNSLLSLSPATMAWDHDDHVLRRKSSDTFAFGFELGYSLGFAFHLNSRMDLAIASDLYWSWTRGKMDQRFYGDDPFTDSEDETGLRIDDVDNRIIGLAGGISLGLNFFF